MRLTNDQKLEALRARRAQIDAELARIQARAKAEARRTDTRKKILAGAVILEEIKKDESMRMYVMDLLERKLFKERDRALFGFQGGVPAGNPAGADGHGPPANDSRSERLKQVSADNA